MTQWFIYLREMAGSMSYPRHIVELMTYSDAFTPQLTECHDPRSQARRSSTADLDSKVLARHQSKHTRSAHSGPPGQAGLARKPSVSVLTMRCTEWVSV